MKKNLLMSMAALCIGAFAGQAHAINCSGIPAWNAATVYANAGAHVQTAGNAYTNKWWTQGENPTASGQWGVWALDGVCDGTTTSSSKSSVASSVASSVKSSTATTSSSSSVVVGNNCTSVSYVAGNNYTAGQLLQNAGNEYRCDIAGWCSSPAAWAYAPGIGTYWTSAWTLVRNCSTSVSSIAISSSSSKSSSSTASSSSSITSNNSTKIGVISYWGTDTSLYNLLPANSTALINPESGIFSGQSQTVVTNINAFSNIVATASARNVNMLAYVPTGYFNHTCNIAGQCQTWARIEAQIQAYFQYMPSLAGVFFDETSPAQWDCNAFAEEYQKLRDLVHKYKSQAKIAYNAGVPDNCVVNGAASGEIVVLFENDLVNFSSQAQNIKVSTSTALAKGVIPWYLVYSVKTVDDLNATFATAKANGVALFYATDIGGNWQAGENTWGSLPPYWSQEVNLMK